MLAELKDRLAPDLFRGVLLEVVQRIVHESQTNLIDPEDAPSDNLLIAHAHLTHVLKDFFIIEQGSDAQSDRGLGEIELADDEDEMDLTKTKDTLWSLLTGHY